MPPLIARRSLPNHARSPKMDITDTRVETVRQSAISFKVKDLTFEGVVAQPEGLSGPMAAVVVCHPHPTRGGNMDNNVVLTLAYSLVDQGFATLRFNFRGVGSSQGQHSEGELEYQEALGALDLMKAWPGVDSRRLGLAGYSFSTSVIMGSASLQKKAKAIALVSPSLRALESTPLKKDSRPIMIVTGDQDNLVQSEQLQSCLDSFAHPPACHIVAGADHFWQGYENQLSTPVEQFFLENLK
ncbi:MAG: dienelactone hydrolase family protein [Chloroflexi bacterium]|nr:dienelactone hydrolase family protein [Chloroflexota bacterium]